MTSLSSEEKKRYGRQIIIPGVGETGQKALKEACVFVAGLGGLGSVSAFYMAAAGVGRLRIADMDVVETGNLNRQIIHRTADVRRPKARSACEKLKALNPGCDVVYFQEKITRDSIGEMAEGAHVILDAADNMAARRVLNRFSIQKGVPYIYGGIDGFCGMVSTFLPGRTPCLECLFPGPGSESGAEEKRKIGVFGPVPGVVASIQSMEAIKCVLGMTEGLLTNTLLYMDCRTMDFNKMEIGPNPDCPVCGP
ncbi:Sulfur carrier protein adenylyltransferase [Candidatus Desulfarcum epimagneticum]|uniref:Sulfur carrier protein adenylyltransferase n=1 Tax=uncultured Desulfobacteraceae bacterium TaxID=218296 RepID=A0A484HGJ1_9BACT|nr:Sulfur carrier protein adenylyltransferase [uncultured Desulfobacteraceae bacterium]